MSGRRRTWTALVAVLLVAAGFAVGAVGSAWQTRQLRAQPWRKMKVEHEGLAGTTTRTRVVFSNPKLPIQAVEVTRSPDGKPELARVALRQGEELTVRYVEKARPSSLEGPDGSRALLGYRAAKARVAFLGPAGRKQGDKVLTVPAGLRSSLRLAQAAPPEGPTLAALWRGLWGSLIGQAWAQEQGEEQVSVRREIAVSLDLQVPGGKAADRGKAEVVASCPPLSCLPATAEVPMPGRSTVRVGVTGTVPAGKLSKPPSDKALKPFKREATDERSTATEVLVDVAGVVAAVGVTALACRSLELTGPLCVKGLGKGASSAGGAVHSVRSHEVDTTSRAIAERARQLYAEDQARAVLDRPTRVRLCLSRKGFARACTDLDARPFAPEPMAPIPRRLELRRGIGGTLEGSFVMTQSDGADCKFSPSPKTRGTLRLSFDSRSNKATATLKADERGTRPDLRCSLGTANMSWSQRYVITASQSFSAEQLASADKLPLRLTGTMSGTGSYGFSNCRTRSGASASCPGGKSDSYSYRVEVLGEIDLASETGTGRIVVHDPPLATRGSWRIPAGESP